MMLRAAQQTKFYENEHHYDTAGQSYKSKDPTKILVVNGDCLDTVRCFKARYPSSNPVVLNMANAYTPGGGWRHGMVLFHLVIYSFFFLKGCGAQEENLHRRTNLFQCLEDSYNQVAETRNWRYPIPEVNLNVSIIEHSLLFFSSGVSTLPMSVYFAVRNPKVIHSFLMVLSTYHLLLLLPTHIHQSN